MSLRGRWQTNRFIDKMFGPDAHTKKGRTLHGNFIDGSKTPPIKITARAIIGLCIITAPVVALFLPNESPDPRPTQPATNSAPFPGPTFEFLPSEDGPTAQNILNGLVISTTTTLNPVEMTS